MTLELGELDLDAEQGIGNMRSNEYYYQNLTLGSLTIDNKKGS